MGTSAGSVINLCALELEVDGDFELDFLIAVLLWLLMVFVGVGRAEVSATV